MNHSFPSRQRGFTFLDVLCTMAIVGILSSIAYPSYCGVMNKVRRSDAQVALLKLQMTQERYRADHMTYGALSDLGMASGTAAGHYTLAVASATESSYQAIASANGTQRADNACRYMKVSVEGLNVSYASGADASTANTDAANRQCWGI